MECVRHLTSSERLEELRAENETPVPRNVRSRAYKLRRAFNTPGRTCAFPQRSQEWFSSRVGRITGSRFGAVMGMDDKCSPDRAMREIIRGSDCAPDESDMNPCNPAHVGVIMEPIAAEIYRINNYPDYPIVSSPPFLYWGARSGASLDAYVPHCGVVVELKCPRYMPDTYSPCHALQLALQCAATGSNRGEVVYSDTELRRIPMGEIIFGDKFRNAEYDNEIHTFPRCSIRHDYIGVVALSGNLCFHPSGDDYESYETLKEWCRRHCDKQIVMWRLKRQDCYRFEIFNDLCYKLVNNATLKLKEVETCN